MGPDMTRSSSRPYAAQINRELLEEALEALDIGVVLVDAASTPLYANSAGIEISRAGERQDGLLSLQALRIAVAQAARTERAQDLQVAGELGQTSVRLSLRPIPGAILILVRPSGTMGGRTLERFATTYALTPRETHVTNCIASGLSVNAAARELNLSVGTVRNHLKRIYDKAGARSQGGLVHLVHQHQLD